MAFQPDPDVITWRLHLRSSPAALYELLASDAGRARFWAEEAVECDGAIDFVFPGGQHWRGAILAREPGRRFSKAAADFGVDLRNHHPARSWEQGYAEN